MTKADTIMQQRKLGAAHLFTALSIFFFVLSPRLSPAQLTTLRIGTNSPASTESVLFSVAKDADVLKQNQLDVEVIFIAGGTLSMQALIGKSLDFLCTGGTPFILAYLEGARGKIIGGVNNRLPYGFVTRASITSPAQLKGKRIGISRFGSTDDFAVKLALAQFGLNSKFDVSITQVGGAATRLTALQAGNIDAAVLTLGLVQIAQKSGLNLLLDFIEKDIEYQQVALIARDDILKTRADVVRRLMRSYLTGIRYYKTQKEVTIRKIMQFLRTNDRQIAEFDYAQRARALPDDGKPTVKGMQLALDDIAKDNPKAKSLTLNQLVDLSFIP
jgi:ABC-type nitrate/sulfonate/bicarbonate transport system substrate-binding protein